MSNPLRLREMQERNGVKSKKDKKDIDEDDAAFKERKKAEAEALKAARDKGTSTYPTIPTYRPHSPTKSPSLEG